MDEPFETIRLTRDGFTGSTFGCSCCSYTYRLSHSSALEEMIRTAIMYEDMARRYRKMAQYLYKYGVMRIRIAIDRVREVNYLESAIDAGEGHLRGENRGTHGAACAEDIDNLRARLDRARMKVKKKDRKIAKVFT